MHIVLDLIISTVKLSGQLLCKDAELQQRKAAHDLHYNKLKQEQALSNQKTAKETESEDE